MQRVELWPRETRLSIPPHIRSLIARADLEQVKRWLINEVAPQVEVFASVAGFPMFARFDTHSWARCGDPNISKIGNIGEAVDKLLALLRCWDSITPPKEIILREWINLHRWSNLLDCCTWVEAMVYVLGFEAREIYLTYHPHEVPRAKPFIARLVRDFEHYRTIVRASITEIASIAEYVAKTKDIRVGIIEVGYGRKSSGRILNWVPFNIVTGFNKVEKIRELKKRRNLIWVKP